MRGAAESCAHQLLETVPLVMRFIRAQVRQRRAASLSLPQFRTLAFLSRTPDASLSEAAEHLGLSLPAVSRLVNGLVAAGLVGRQAVSTNRRQIALTLTARGRASLDTVRNEVRLHLADALRPLPTAEQQAVQRALSVLQHIFGPPPAARSPARKVKP